MNPAEYSIAIIDDNLDEMEILEYHLREMQEFKIKWKENRSFNALQRFDEQPVDILILDMNMPVLNGFELIKSLKEIPIIIVCSNFPEYIYDVSEYQVEFIRKSANKDVLRRVMDKAKRLCEEKFYKLKSFNRWISIPTIKREGSQMRLEVDNLVYASIDDKTMSFFFDDTSLRYGIISMDSLLEKLPKPFFIRVHKSYLVNIKYVNEYSAQFIILKSLHLRIPIGRSYLKNVKKILDGKISLKG